MPLVAVAVLVLGPAPYTNASTPLLDRYDRLVPHTPQLGITGTAVPGYRTELCRYLSVPNCRIVDYWTVVRPVAAAGESLDAVLAQMDVRLFYADEAVLKDPVAAGLIGGTNPLWKRIAGSEGRWGLFKRVSDSPQG